jgi:hypothetical protein
VLGSPPDRWVFLTGTPRSGTTFLGNALSADPRTDYFHEPFNPAVGAVGWDRWYCHPDEDRASAAEFAAAARRLRAYDLPLRHRTNSADPLTRRAAKRVLGSRGVLHRRLALLNVRRRAAVVKCPIGIFAGPALRRDHGVVVVAVTRHPAGILGSYERLGWDTRANIARILAQPLLVERYLAEDPAVGAPVPECPDEAAVTLWRLGNRFLTEAARRGELDRFVRLEELALEPVGAVAGLAGEVGLPWGAVAAWRVAKMTDAGNAADNDGRNVQRLRRDTRSLATRHLNLTQDRLDEIRTWAGDVGAKLYPEPEHWRSTGNLERPSIPA